MAEYFEGAFLTISADSCASPSDRILKPLHEKISRKILFKMPREIIHEMLPVSPSYWDAADREPVSSRGWTFQETALSRRTIHYLSHGLKWECRGCVEFEDQMLLRCEQFGASSFRPSYTVALSMQSLDFWGDVISAYSLRKLTVYKDKLPAISGIANTIHKATGATYVAGLWKETLPYSLVWKSKPQDSKFQQPMPTDEGTPSWSWASVDGQISAMVFKTEKKLHHTVSVLDCQCAPMGLNPFGQVRGGYITIRDTVTLARLKATNCLNMEEYRLVSLGKNEYTSVYIDTALEECFCRTPIYNGCRSLRRTPAGSFPIPAASFDAFVELLYIMSDAGCKKYLILGRSDAVEGAHTRLGVFDADPAIWKDFDVGRCPEPIIVTIV